MSNSEQRSEEPTLEQPLPNSEQYEAGHASCHRGESMSVSATQSWQAGWTDANRELGNFELKFTPAQASLPFFGTGEEARRRGLRFDASCSEAWKRGWIEADIALGVVVMASEG